MIALFTTPNKFFRYSGTIASIIIMAKLAPGTFPPTIFQFYRKYFYSNKKLLPLFLTCKQLPENTAACPR